MDFYRSLGVRIGESLYFFAKRIRHASPLLLRSDDIYRMLGHTELLVAPKGKRVLTKKLAITKKTKPNYKVGNYTPEGNIESHDRHYSSDNAIAAYNYLECLARKQGKVLTLATVNLSDEMSVNIRIKASKKVSGAGIVKQKLKDGEFEEPMLLVIEESNESTVTHKAFKSPEKRIHAHILTITTEESREHLGSILKPLGSDNRNAVVIKTDYIRKVPYTELHQIDEDEFGKIPQSRFHKNPYWLNQWRRRNSVWTRKPIDIGIANYLSKTLHKPITHGKNFAMSKIPSLASIKKQIADRNRPIKAPTKLKVVEGQIIKVWGE